MRAERPEIFNADGEVHHALRLNHENLDRCMRRAQAPKDTYHSLGIVLDDATVNRTHSTSVDAREVEGMFMPFGSFVVGAREYNPIIVLPEDFRGGRGHKLVHELGHLVSYACHPDRFERQPFYANERLVKHTKRVGLGIMAMGAVGALFAPVEVPPDVHEQIPRLAGHDILPYAYYAPPIGIGWQMWRSTQELLWKIEPEERRARRFEKRYRDDKFVAAR